MRAVVDQDHAVLERWADMADADTSVVFDAHLGGYPGAASSASSREPSPARAGSRPTARTSGRRGRCSRGRRRRRPAPSTPPAGTGPLVVLANLSGFDGSPESLRNIQLEYGAEIGRAIVNFDGPIVFCVVSRYHGGAFVVFSGALNDNMEVLAVEGSFASVLGGAPAAAVVFTRDVNARTAADPTVKELEARLDAAEDDAERARLRVELADRATRSPATTSSARWRRSSRRSTTSSAHRRVGSVHHIVPAAELRPQLVAAVERGMARSLAK